MQRALSLTEQTVLGLIGLSSFLGLWSLLAVSGFVPKQFLPAPWEVVERAALLTNVPFAGSTIQGHLLSSMQRFLYGFVLAAAIGIPLGLAMGWYRWLDAIVSPIFDGLRFVAPIAWVPFAALWFGTGIGGPIMIIFSGAFPPCLINAYRGAKFLDRRLLEASQMLGTSGFRTVTQVLMPATVPSILAGLRISAGLGWQSLIGAELIVASAGVGYMMVQGQSNVSTPTVMAGMFAIGIIGYLIDVVLRRVGRSINRKRGLE